MMELRETCQACGETHVTRAIGLTNNSYAVVVDSCVFCDHEKEEAERVAAYLDLFKED